MPREICFPLRLSLAEIAIIMHSDANGGGVILDPQKSPSITLIIINRNAEVKHVITILHCMIASIFSERDAVATNVNASIEIPQLKFVIN